MDAIEDQFDIPNPVLIVDFFVGIPKFELDIIE